MTGNSNRVPKDRPIDGVDFSKLLLGQSNQSGREHYMFFGVDGELMSIKWRYYKMVKRGFRGPELATLGEGAVDFQLPKFFNLSNDPHEDFNLWDTELTMGRDCPISICSLILLSSASKVAFTSLILAKPTTRFFTLMSGSVSRTGNM